FASSRLSRARSAISVSDCELTETYSPAAMDIAPATSPAMPASNTLVWDAAAEATPRIRLAVEMIPSFAPSTAARSHPIRPTRCVSPVMERPFPGFSWASFAARPHRVKYENYWDYTALDAAFSRPQIHLLEFDHPDQRIAMVGPPVSFEPVHASRSAPCPNR